jgi:hypothetical protein
VTSVSTGCGCAFIGFPLDFGHLAVFERYPPPAVPGT